MAFLNKSFSQILNDMLTHLTASSSISDANVGSVARTLMESVALVMDEAYFQLVNILNSSYLNTATGTDLDKKASDFGVQRKLSLQSNVLVTFSGSGAPIIPSGTIVYVPASGNVPQINFLTTAAGSLNTPIPAICQIAGSLGNVGVGSINKISNNPDPTLITGVTNSDPASGGQDQEADNTFRGRIQAYLLSLSKGTVNSIISACLNVTSVKVAKVLEGFSVSGYILSTSPSLIVNDLSGSATLNPPNFPGTQLGNITVIIDNGTGSLPDSIVPTVQDILLGDPNNPTVLPGYVAAGIQCFTTRPKNAVVTIDIAISINENILDTATLENTITNTLASFIQTKDIGAELFLSEIVDQVMNLNGVTDIPFATILLNGTNNNVTPTPAEKLIPGTITITIL